MATAMHRLRKFERIRVDMPVYVSTPSQGIHTDSVRMREVGEGGCLLVNHEFYGVGRILTLDIPVSGRPLRAIAKVLYEYRNSRAEVFSGLEFQFLTEDHQFRLRSFIHHRMTEETRATA